MMHHCRSIALLLSVFASLELCVRFCSGIVHRHPDIRYPWFSAILKGIDEEDFLCGGALISPKHVITADHCLFSQSIDSLFVRVGYFCPHENNCGQPFSPQNIFERRRDPAFADVAILVLFLEVPSTFAPAILDVGSPSYLSGLKKGDEMLLVGAGLDGSTTGKLADRVATLRLQLLHKNYTKCGHLRLVSKSTICTVSHQGSPCAGDAGGPILVEDGDDVVVVAIHSFGPSVCSSAHEKSVFGHAAISRVASFVASVVCIGGDKKLEGTWCPSTTSRPPLPSTEAPASLAPTTLPPRSTTEPQSSPTRKVEASNATSSTPSLQPTTSVSPPSSQPSPNGTATPGLPAHKDKEEEGRKTSGKLWPLFLAIGFGVFVAAIAILLWKSRGLGNAAFGNQQYFADDFPDEYANISLPSIQRKYQRLRQQQRERG